MVKKINILFWKYNLQFYKNFAFTLAEVLITLGIIGVVAAITMPTLIKDYKAKVFETQFKKAYTDLNTASKNFQIHNEMSVSEYASTYMYNYAPVIRALSKEFSGSKTESKSNYVWKDFKKIYSGYVCDSDVFLDNNGRIYNIDDLPISGQNGPKVCVDINGKKGPNIVGIDLFVFMFTVDGYAIPYGKEHPNNPSINQPFGNYMPDIVKDYCKHNNGTMTIHAATCSLYAINNQHPTNPNKDYWHDFINE